MIKPLEFESTRVEKLRTGLVFGLVAGSVFSLTAWGYDGFQLARSHAIYPWLTLLLGGIPATLFSGLAGWLVYRLNHFLAAFVIWLATGIVFSWLAAHIPFDVLSGALGVIDPSVRELVNYPSVIGAQARTTVIFITVIGLTTIAGMLEISLVDWTSESIAPVGRVFPVLIWVFLFFLVGLSPENNIGQDLTKPVVSMNQLIQFASDHRNQEVDKAQAVEMHLGAVRDLQDYLDLPRRLVLTRYDELMYTTTVAVDFDGQWASCSLAAGIPSYCKPVTRAELLQSP